MRFLGMASIVAALSRMTEEDDCVVDRTVPNCMLISLDDVCHRFCLSKEDRQGQKGIYGCAISAWLQGGSRTWDHARVFILELVKGSTRRSPQALQDKQSLNTQACRDMCLTTPTVSRSISRHETGLHLSTSTCSVCV